MRHAAQREGLNDAQLADGCGKFLERRLVERGAGLFGVGRNLFDGDFVDGRRTACLYVVHGDERVESATQGVALVLTVHSREIS